MHLVKTITVLPLAFICHWANADLGFFGEVHGHHYRQKESVDLDPYSLDFDFLHEGDDSPKTPPYTNSGTDLSSSSPYKPPALIGQFKTNDYSPYKDQGSFKPSAPSGPSGFENLYPKGKINNFEYKKPEIHSPSPVYDQYKESTPIYHKSPTTYGSSKPAIFNPTSFGQGKDYEGDVKSHISGGYEGEIKSHPSGGYEEPKANYDDYESEDYSSSYSPPPPNYQREKNLNIMYLLLIIMIMEEISRTLLMTPSVIRITMIILIMALPIKVEKTMIPMMIIMILSALSTIRLSESLDFHSNVRYFETLHASQFNHNIVKRGTSPSNHKYNKIREVDFKALVEIDDDNNERMLRIDHENFYDGRVFGEVKSRATVHMEKGMITAKIETPEDTYHIEPSWRHLKDTDEQTMIAYRESDVNFSWNLPDSKTGFVPQKVCDFIKENGTAPGKVLMSGPKEALGGKSRHKRQTSEYLTILRQTRCPLLLVADYRFFKEMGGGNSKTTVNYLISLIDRVHKIYEETVWIDKLDTQGFSGMGFIIKKIVVHRNPTAVRDKEVHYNMERTSWDVRNLLEVFSREFTHKDFCLAHLFTDIKFEGGILGLAYVGSPRRNSVGGICTPEYFKNGYTLYLNSGLSSSRNHYGQRVITREADLVTAHEFGHNWGSEHDPDIKECSPSASHGGSYLMYTYSVSGYDVNNKKFSPCSLRFIRKVLLAKSGRCFTEPEESFCGISELKETRSAMQDYLALRIEMIVVMKIRGDVCRHPNYATCEQRATCDGKAATCPLSLPMEDGIKCVEEGECRNGKCVPFCETKDLQSSLLFWIPVSCLISWIDRRRAEKDQKEWEWRRQDELIHPEDRRKIIHIRVPRRNLHLASSAM
ncbi:ADAM17 [Lepeophtheirus salmonis]|uniref:ADAM17 n=1 Tax=Lepeophtheirus salmonis TaxID=72036 RepID=A0A7R8CV34_LEPSM|nr:ADAM17 [Lepeophtheirus salmonis]CAF2941790.1 ADAM17 [Lepeophtheirus salmonis]